MIKKVIANSSKLALHCMASFKFIAIAFLTLAACPTHGQDYIVTVRGDTLRGKVRIIPLSNIDNAQVIVENKKSEHSALNTLVVSMGPDKYHTISIVDGYRFLKLAKSGAVNIYMARQSEGMPYNIPYLVKKTGEVLEVPNLFFGKKMASFLKDCPAIKQKLEDGQFGKKDLNQIVDEYNQCIEDQTKKAFASTQDPKLVALFQLNGRLREAASIPADVMDILADMYQKVKDGKGVPNYMIVALRGSLKDYPGYQMELDTLVEKLKN